MDLPPLPAEGASPIFVTHRAFSTRNTFSAAKIGPVPRERLWLFGRASGAAAARRSGSMPLVSMLLGVRSRPPSLPWSRSRIAVERRKRRTSVHGQIRIVGSRRLGL